MSASEAADRTEVTVEAELSDAAAADAANARPVDQAKRVSPPSFTVEAKRQKSGASDLSIATASTLSAPPDDVEMEEHEHEIESQELEPDPGPLPQHTEAASSATNAGIESEPAAGAAGGREHVPLDGLDPGLEMGANAGEVMADVAARNMAAHQAAAGSTPGAPTRRNEAVSGDGGDDDGGVAGRGAPPPPHTHTWLHTRL